MDNEKLYIEAQGHQKKENIEPTQQKMEEISRRLVPLVSRMILTQLALNTRALNNVEETNDYLNYQWAEGFLDLINHQKKENGEALFFSIERNRTTPEKTTIACSWHNGSEIINLFWNLILRKEFDEGNYSMEEPLDIISIQINVEGAENSPWPLPQPDDFSKENYRNSIPTNDTPFRIRVKFPEHNTLQHIGLLETPTNSIPYSNAFGLETMKWALQVSKDIFNWSCSILEKEENISIPDVVRNFIEKNKKFMQEKNPFPPPFDIS